MSAFNLHGNMNERIQRSGLKIGDGSLSGVRLHGNKKERVHRSGLKIGGGFFFVGISFTWKYGGKNSEKQS